MLYTFANIHLLFIANVINIRIQVIFNSFQLKILLATPVRAKSAQIFNSINNYCHINKVVNI